MRNCSYENEFDFHDSDPVWETHFHMNRGQGLSEIAYYELVEHRTHVIEVTGSNPVSELPCISITCWVLMQNCSHENEFDFHDSEPVGETNFHMNRGQGVRIRAPIPWPM